MLAGGHSASSACSCACWACRSAKDGQHLAIDSIIAVGKSVYRFLAQIAQPAAAGDVDLPGGRLVDAGQDQQQRGFADAVGPDQADLAVIGDRYRNPLEEVKGSKRETQVICGQR